MTASKQGIINRILGRTGVTTKLDYLQADSVLSPDVSADNYIINGGFDFWQRGTSFSPTTTKKHASDRFSIYDAETQSTITRVASSFSTSEYGLKFQRTAGSSAVGHKYICQSLEIKNSRPLTGKNVTFSFKAKAGANFLGSLYMIISSGTQSDDRDYLMSAFDGLVDNLKLITLSTQFQTFSHTAIIPSSAKQVAVSLRWVPSGTSGADDSFTIEQLMLNPGSQPAPFVRAGKTIGGELALCQRYYEILNVFGRADGSSNLLASVNFRAQKRNTSLIVTNAATYGLGAVGTIYKIGTGNITAANNGMLVPSVNGCYGLSFPSTPLVNQDFYNLEAYIDGEI